MKRPSVFILCLAFLLQPALFFGPGAKPGDALAQGNPNGRSVTVAFFYKVKWGHQDEFLELFRKNHYPVLEAQVKGGRLLRVKAYTPRFHSDGRSDWTFMTVLVFKAWQAFGDNSAEAEIIKQLYPDQDKNTREE